ncbi:HPr family phosphocarrier protein [bacterium 0.1xD8-71]|nr:HPr family phosphocarrier protein [bacterium 0.1xD8-71]
MQQVHVKFNDVNQVRKFVDVIDKIDLCFNLGEGRRIVDAKSILGVLALDLTRPLRLSYDSDDEGIREKLAPFIY